MLSVKVAGVPLSTIGHGPVTIEHGLHGSEAASWEMRPNQAHPALRGNARVEVFDGGLCVWCGNLIEPGTGGEFAAKGSWKQADVPALDVAGNPTSVPDDAIAGAYSRGEISWTGTVSATAWATASTELTLANLLDGYTAENALRWVVSPTGLVSTRVDPTTPAWHVPNAVAGSGLTPAEDEFATHLVGTYLVSAGVFATETVGSAEAATFFGRRTVRVDLIPLGFITAARANAMLAGMFLRAGARMGWSEGLDLGYGQITTPGGIPATLAQIEVGQMVRLSGVFDTSRANLLPASTDIVIATSRYTDGSGRIQLTPLGYAPRNFRDVLAAAVKP